MKIIEKWNGTSWVEVKLEELLPSMYVIRIREI